jgi:hypothetical protein
VRGSCTPIQNKLSHSTVFYFLRFYATDGKANISEQYFLNSIRTIKPCPNKLFYTKQGEEETWAVLERDGQLMSEQETLLYPEVMMMNIKPYHFICNKTQFQ